MPRVYAELTVDCPVQEVYAYLKGRYQTQTFRAVSLMTKGYVPDVRCLEDRKDELLSFYVAGRDALLKFKVPGWQWSYQLAPIDQHRTGVTIVYQWGVLSSLLAVFTARQQAANELVETALALEALAAREPLQPASRAGD